MASSQVASPVWAGAPWPPPRTESQLTAPSPQSPVTRLSVIRASWLSPERLTAIVRVTLLITAPAGRLAATSKRSSARRKRPSLVTPENRFVPAPQLLSSKFSPVTGSMPW